MENRVFPSIIEKKYALVLIVVIFFIFFDIIISTVFVSSVMNISLLSPVNYFNSSINSIIVECSSNITSGSATLQNLSIWSNQTGSWIRNKTITFNTSNNYLNYSSGTESEMVTYGTVWYGQSFTTPSSGFNVSSIGLKLATYGSPIGNFSVLLRNNFDPPNLAFTNISVSSLNTTNTWYNLTFNSSIVLNASTIYSFVIYCQSCDINNRIRYSTDSGAGYGGGSQRGATDGSYSSGSTWVAETHDILFYFYSSTTNYSLILSNLTLTNGLNWTCDSCDADGACSFSSENRTAKIDTSSPLITIIKPTGSYSSLIIPFNISIEEDNPNYCYYNVTRGDSTEVANTQINCLNNYSFYLNGSFSVSSDFSTYMFHFWMNDSFGYSNYSNISFSVSSGGLGGGGGGGGSVTKFTVIALIKDGNSSIDFSELDRAKLYARIRDICLDNLCSLSNEQKSNLQESLRLNELNVDLRDLNIYISQYKNKQFEEVAIDEANIERFKLFKATIELLANPFKISPSVLDKFWFINFAGNSVSITVYPNKPLQSCKIINATTGWACSVLKDSAIINYTLPNSPDFTARVIKTTISYTSEKGENTFQDVQLRAFYFNKSTLIISALVLSGLIFSIVLFKKRIKLKKINFSKIFV